MALRLVCLCLAVLLGFASGAFGQSQLINGGLVVVGPQNWCASAVGSDAYACALDRTLTAYVTGARYAFTADVANTGAATLALNGLAAKTLKTRAGAAKVDLATGALCAGQMVEVLYDGTDMQVLSQACTMGTTVRIASGTATLGTSAIAAEACATVVTVSASGVATTDVIDVAFNSDPTGVTGYVPLSTGALTIIPYPTANTINIKVCNYTAASLTPGAITLNWRVDR